MLPARTGAPLARQCSAEMKWDSSALLDRMKLLKLAGLPRFETGGAEAKAGIKCASLRVDYEPLPGSAIPAPELNVWSRLVPRPIGVRIRCSSKARRGTQRKPLLPHSRIATKVLVGLVRSANLSRATAFVCKSRHSRRTARAPTSPGAAGSLKAAAWVPLELLSSKLH